MSGTTDSPASAGTSPVVKTSASAGVAGAIIVVVQWLLSLGHVALPVDVGAALIVIISPLVHLIGQTLGSRKQSGTVAAPAATSRPLVLREDWQTAPVPFQAPAAPAAPPAQ